VTDALLDRLIGWAERTPEIRAVLLTSSRARADGPTDEFSDWDVVLAVTDPAAWAEGDLAWQAELGRRLVGWGDEDELLGQRTYFRGVIYDDHTRVDYSLWPVKLADAVGNADHLPPELDDGYEVLLDKDGRAADWPPPSLKAYVLQPPSAAEYRALVEEFWWNMSYLPKSMRRGDLFFLSSWMLEHDQKIVCLRRMLEWRIAAEHGWTWSPRPYGQRLEEHLDEGTRAALAGTYAGLDPEAIWTAAFRLAELFRRVAIDVASTLGYTYPESVDARMTAYLQRMRGGE
jgi:aminoglycoside 6-adenylyltransferase